MGSATVFCSISSSLCRRTYLCLPPFCLCLVLLLLIPGVSFCQLFILLCVQWSPLSVVPSLSHCFFCFVSSSLSSLSVPSPVSSLSLFGFSPPLSLRFSLFFLWVLFFLFCLPPFLLSFGSPFIEPAGVASPWSQGAGRGAAGRGAAVQAGLPRLRQRGGSSASVFCRWPTGVGPRSLARGTCRKLNNANFSFFPAVCLGGRRKGNSAVQNGTVRSFFFYV